jgi:hypothetical protein
VRHTREGIVNRQNTTAASKYALSHHVPLTGKYVRADFSVDIDRDLLQYSSGS